MENEKKKKILYLITQSELGGAQVYCLDLAKGLQNEYEISFGFGEQGESGELAKKLNELGIENYTIKNLVRNISPINDFLALINIIKLINKVKPDIIHLNSSKISILGSLAATIIKLKYKNIKIIYTAHGWVFNEPMSQAKKLFYKYAEKLSAMFKDKIICVSEFDRLAGLEEKIAPAEKLITIHNGIKKINFLAKEEAREKLFSKINDPRSTIHDSRFTIHDSRFTIIGSIGNLYQTKGFEYLIEAAQILHKENLDFKLIIIGEGNERQRLENIISYHNLENTVFLAGRIDKARELLPAFDIYVCSSVKEGLSYTIIEAMQARLPIVATNVGGNSELITNNETGLLVEPASAKKLSEAIKKIIQDINLQNTIKTQAETKALDEFTLEQMIAKTKQVYKNISDNP